MPMFMTIAVNPIPRAMKVWKWKKHHLNLQKIGSVPEKDAKLKNPNYTYKKYIL